MKMAKKAKAVLRTEAEKAALRVATGRPSKYDPAIVDKFIEYFSKPPYKRNPITGRDEATDFPSLAGFAISIGIDRTTLKEWADEYPDFSLVYKKAQQFQENFLSVNGPKGLINPAFGIFIAKNKLGWTDKQEIKHEGQIDSKISVEKIDLDERVKALKGKE
jgi:hypothetical protein